MVSSNGVTNKSQGLVSHELKKLGRVENGEVAGVGLPSPLHEAAVGPSIFHAVLVLVNGPTRGACVVRGVGVWDPFAGENVALVLLLNGIGVWRRRGGGGGGVVEK